MPSQRSFSPEWTVHPGATVADSLEALGMTQATAASRLGVSKKHLNDVVRGRAGIQPEFAHALSLVLGSTPEFWLRLQAHYDAETVRLESENRMAESHADWVKSFPITEMKKLNWITHSGSVASKANALLQFFAVADKQGWEKIYAEKTYAFRTSPSFDAAVGATTAWLRQAELTAQAIEMNPFDPKAFHAALSSLRELSRRDDFQTAWSELQSICAHYGVAAVLVPAPKGCRASGATFFATPDRAVLALSGRHLTDDHLWFSFFHEAAHLVLHGKKLTIIEGLDGLDKALEDEADTFSADLLIPPEHLPSVRTLRTREAIERKAEELSIAPGIIVGRLQREGLVPFSRLNTLKKKYVWGPTAT